MRKYTYIIFMLMIAMMMTIPVMAQEGEGDGIGDHDQIQESGGDPAMFRKNVSKTPEMASAKAKLNIMPVWIPALTASGDSTIIEYLDEDGNVIREATEAKPLVVVYADEVEETGAHDVFAAISRDDGNTWKRKNVSRMAERSSFTLEEGDEPYYGHCKKPVFQVKGNQILIAWSSKYAKGGKPAYAIDPLDDYPHDDLYYTEDIWGVSGPQKSHDYAEDGFTDVGEVPYSAVWTVRGIVDKGTGDIVWYKPERLTSARRDAYQLFVGGADGAGFGVVWQEDPEGIRPGKGVGPGHGWSGATTNHKTDIWYSYITRDDFAKVDGDFVAGGDPEHTNEDFVERPKALVPMSLPVRISDNDVVNTENLKVELDGDGYPIEDVDGNWIPSADEDTGDGSHLYGEEICVDFELFENQQLVDKLVCVTEDGRLLDGDTGASRPNLFLQTYTKPDGSKSAWAIVAYEETKGLGAGPPDHDSGQPDPEVDGSGNDVYVPDEGKNAIYHSFDFQDPDLVSAGNILNLPVTDNGALVYVTDENGARILDYKDQPILAYENARRPRFVLQGKSAVGDSNTTMLVLYKQGEEGMGRPSDIMLRRCVANTPGNPYAFSKIVCNSKVTAENGEEVCVDGAQNVSSVTPTEIAEDVSNSDQDEPYGDTKILAWEQTDLNLTDQSGDNKYDDARAHRGAIRGDFVVIGYSWTPNWAASRNYHDKYDFYIRRSFNGGQTWTTDPDGRGDVIHTDIFIDPDAPDGEKHPEVITEYGPGEWEPARNVSLLTNSKETVIEPRIVAVPGTIKVDGVWTGFPEDKQDPDVFYVSYGLAANDDSSAPTDLYWSFSQDKGQSLYWEEKEISTESDGNNSGETVMVWPWLAKDKDAEEGEAQLRMTPDGSRFYAAWLREGEDGSDIWMRRIMPPEFGVNTRDAQIFQADELLDEAWTIDLLGVEVGDSIFYNITVTNVYDELLDLTIYDELSQFVEYNSGSFALPCDFDGRNLSSFHVGLDTGQSLELNFEVTVMDTATLGDTIENFVKVKWSNGIEKFSNLTIAEVVPEPSTLILLGLGVVGLLGFARKKRNRKQ